LAWSFRVVEAEGVHHSLGLSLLHLPGRSREQGLLAYVTLCSLSALSEANPGKGHRAPAWHLAHGQLGDVSTPAPAWPDQDRTVRKNAKESNVKKKRATEKNKVCN
jgi:hypothetical protein